MAPCKAAKPIKVRVPRQNAQRLGPNLNSTVRSVGRKDGFIVQIPPPVQEQPSAAGASSSAVSCIVFLVGGFEFFVLFLVLRERGGRGRLSVWGFLFLTFLT